MFYSLSEEHIKQDINNYFLNNNVCELHKEKIIYYCIDCNLYLCGTCSENGSHKEHEIKDIKSLILPKDHIDEIYNRIKDYDAFFAELDNIGSFRMTLRTLGLSFLYCFTGRSEEECYRALCGRQKVIQSNHDNLKR